MSEFVKQLRYLNSFFPPSRTEFHNPNVVLDQVRLTQEVNPLSNRMDAPVLFSVDGAALSGIVNGEFVSEDATPSGIFGVAFILWAAAVIHVAGPAATPTWFLEDQTGALRVALTDIQALAVGSPGLSLAAGSRGTLPFIVPHKFRVVVICPELVTLRLRYIRTTVLRGETLYPS